MLSVSGSSISGFPIVEFDGVTKVYNMNAGRTFVRNYLAAKIKRSRPEVFHAVRNVSFSIAKGESLGVVGSNGAGKTTLLSLVAGVTSPTRGRIAVNGSVAALLALGAGFHADLTGRENVFLNASLLGLSRSEVRAAFDSIVDFSEIRAFIDEPLRTYSSGMVMRLAFAVAVHVNPDILVIDEALSVGDQHFAAKCVERIFKFKDEGKTFVCVSHAPDILQRLCEHSIWLERGQVVMIGRTSEVLEAYHAGSHGRVFSA
jgi:ABC-type polysaccharide/polyol phosphate transport system ATPase subunit